MTLECAITVIEIGIVHFVRNSPSKSLQPSPWAPLLRPYRPAEERTHMNISQIKKHAIAHKLEDSRDEWLKQRNKGLGGSDAGSVLGLSPYKSAYTLWAEKTGLIDSHIPDNEAMRVGRDLEQYVAERFTEATGLKVQRSGYSFQSKEHPWMLGNVDRLIVGENAGLECKTANALTKTDYSGGDIPAAYYAQCYHYMAVTGADAWYIAILVMGKGFYWHKIERDEAEIEALISAEKDFWQLVQDRKPPALDGSDSTKESLMWRDEPLEPEDVFRDMEDLADLLEKRAKLDTEEKALKELKAICDNQIRDAMGAYTKGKYENYSVTYKPRVTVTVNKRKLEQEFPEAWEECTSESPSRPLLIKKLKPKKGRTTA